jgi:hypothetical protein
MRICVQIDFGSVGHILSIVEKTLNPMNKNGTRADGRHELLYGTARQTMGCLTSSPYSIQENAPQLPQLPDRD